MKQVLNGMSVLPLAFLLVLASATLAQDDSKQKSMEIYGFIMLDAGYNFDQIHPDWYNVVRPTKLPAFKNQYGANGNTYFSVWQTRLGFKNYFQTGMGELIQGETRLTFALERPGASADQGIYDDRLELRRVEYYSSSEP